MPFVVGDWSLPRIRTLPMESASATDPVFLITKVVPQTEGVPV